jgi:multidrug transporter EmrE-like cation transporter
MAGAKVNLHWGALALAIATSMIAQTLLKVGSGAPNFVAQLFDPRTIFGLGLYAGSALFYIIALRKIPMSVALPFTAVSYVAAALIGHYGFAEPLGIPKIAGIAMICLGVVMLTLA